MKKRILLLILSFLIILSACATGQSEVKDEVKQKDKELKKEVKHEVKKEVKQSETKPKEVEQSVNEPAAQVLKGNYPNFYVGQTDNKIMEYVLEKVRNYEFEIELEEARKATKIANLDMKDLVEYASGTLENNPQFALANTYVEADKTKVYLNELNQSKGEIQKRREEIKKMVFNLLDQYDFEGKSDYEKSLMINEIILDYMDYDHDVAALITPNNTTIEALEPKKAKERFDRSSVQGPLYQALKEKIAVCDGYAKLYQALATAVGLDSYYVSGWVYPDTEQAINHAWNWVKINDKFYVVDVTWNETGAEEREVQTDYIWLHLPLNYVINSRGHDTDGRVINEVLNTGEDFDQTYYAHNNMMVEKDKIIPTMQARIKELKSRKQTSAKDWSFSIYNYEVTAEEREEIQKTLNSNLNENLEGVTYIEGEICYINYQKHFKK